MVGAITSKLKLDKSGWDQSIKGIKDDQSAIAKFATKNSKSMQTMGKAMTIAGGAIIGISGGMVKAFTNFDAAMTQSTAIMGNVSDVMRRKMADAAREMSTKTTYSAKELAEAYYFLASAGMNAEQSIGALPVVAKFAQAGMFNLATATDLLTDAQTALRLNSDDLEENQKNLIRVSDVLVGANTLANASVQQFSESLTNKAAAALFNVNKEVEEGVAVLAAYADAGVKGNLAGQRLTMMLNGLEDASRNNKGEWDKFGISLFDSSGQMRSVADIVGDLEDNLGDMTPELRQAAIFQLGFNLKTKDSILTLMGSSEKIRENTELLKNMGGITEEVARKQLETFNNKMKLLKNQVTSVAIELGENLMPTVETIVGSISKAVKGVSDWVKENPKLTASIVKISTGLGGLMLILGPLVMLLPQLVTSIGLVKIGLIGLVSSAGGFATLLAGIFATIYIGFDALGDVMERSSFDVKLADEAYKTLGVTLEDVQKQAGLTDKEWKKLIKSKKDSVPILQKLGIVGKNQVKWLDDSTRAQFKNNYELMKAIENGELGKDIQDAYREAIKETTKEQEAKEKIQKAINDLEETAAGITSNLTGEIEENEEATKAAKEEMERWKRVMDTLRGETIPQKRRRITELEIALKNLDHEYETGILTLAQYKAATTNAKDEIKRLSGEIEMTAVPAARDMYAVWQSMPGVMEGITFPGKTHPLDAVKDKLFDVTGRMTEKWGYEIGEMLRGAQSFKELLDGIWDSILIAFTDMVGKMIAEWISGFIEKMISSLVEDLFPAVSAMFLDIETGATSAFSTIEVGAAALAAYVGFTMGTAIGMLIESLFKLGDAAEGNLQKLYSWVTSLIQPSKELAEWFERIFGLVASFEGHEFIIVEGFEGVTPEDITRLLGLGRGGGGRQGVIGAQGGFEGYVSQAAQPFVAHRGEYVSVTPAHEVAGGGGGRVADVRMSIENTFHIQALDPSTMRDIVRNQIEPQILDSIETNVKKIRWQEALGVA